VEGNEASAQVLVVWFPPLSARILFSGLQKNNRWNQRYRG